MKPTQRSSTHPRVSRPRAAQRRSLYAPVCDAESTRKGANVGTSRVAEDPADEYLAKPRHPQARLRILVLEDRSDPLHAASRSLRSSGYTASTITDEGHAVASILADEGSHFLLLTAHHTARPLSVPQVIERLRQLRYNEPVTYCLRGKVSTATRAAYKAISVDRVLALPVKAQKTVLGALSWIARQVALGGSGLTILEV